MQRPCDGTTEYGFACGEISGQGKTDEEAHYNAHLKMIETIKEEIDKQRIQKACGTTYWQERQKLLLESKAYVDAVKAGKSVKVRESPTFPSDKFQCLGQIDNHNNILFKSMKAVGYGATNNEARLAAFESVSERLALEMRRKQHESLRQGYLNLSRELEGLMEECRKAISLEEFNRKEKRRQQEAICDDFLATIDDILDPETAWRSLPQTPVTEIVSVDAPIKSALEVAVEKPS